MPTKKAKEIDDLLTAIAGVSRQDAATLGICNWCKKPIDGFRNEISEREWEISGFCQKCQDETFGED
jgi:hypothetical protein